VSDPLDQVRLHRAGLRAAINQVEHSLARPAPDRVADWCKELGIALDGLSAALSRHVTATEAPDGLLADVMQAAPRLAHRIDVIRGDHERLREQLDAVLARIPVDETGVAELREQVDELLTGLSRHRQAGADLVYAAYQVDIEASD
jgi:hemerythrin HHE cation binding domain-containing protein